MTDSLGAVRRLSELMRRVNSSSDTDDDQVLGNQRQQRPR